MKNNLYVISMDASTCCDYWDMDVIVVAPNYEDAKLYAADQFNEVFKVKPSSIQLLQAIPFDKLKVGTAFIISLDKGSK